MMREVKVWSDCHHELVIPLWNLLDAVYYCVHISSGIGCSACKHVLLLILKLLCWDPTDAMKCNAITTIRRLGYIVPGCIRSWHYLSNVILPKLPLYAKHICTYIRSTTRPIHYRMLKPANRCFCFKIP